VDRARPAQPHDRLRGEFGSAAGGERTSINPFGTPDDVVGDDLLRRTTTPPCAWSRPGARRGSTAWCRCYAVNRPRKWRARSALCDQLAHGWDLAQATGQQLDVDPDAVDAAWDFTQENMGPAGRGEGKPFQEAVDISESEPKLERLMAFMGRQAMTH